MNRKVMGLIWDVIRELGARDIIFIIINNVFGILGSSINPLIIKYLMDGVQSHNEISFWFWLKIGIFYNIMTYLVFNIFFIGSGITIDVKNSTNFYKKWFDKIVTLDGQYFDNKGSSKVSSITNDCTNGMSNISNIFFYSILPSFFRITSAFVFIYIFAGRKFFLIGLTIFVIYIYITYRAQSKARPNRKEQHKNNHNRGKHMSKVLASKTENLISNKISHEVGILKNFLDRTLKISIIRAYIILPQNTQNIISPLSKLAAYFYFFENYYNKSITLGSIYIINDSINRIFANIGDVVDLANNITDHFTKLEEFQTEIVEAPQMIGYYDGQRYIYKGGDINIDNISFAYTKFDKKELENKKYEEAKNNKISQSSEKSSDESSKSSDVKPKYIFKNFSLKIAGGRKIAFVGASGGGKTTLVKLILGLLNTNEGQIYIDDQKLPNIYTANDEYISLSSYYHYVGYLSQDPGVFDGNILDNLLYGLKEVENKSDEIKSEYTSDIKKDAINGRLYNDIFVSLNEEDQKYFTEEVIEKLSKYVSIEEEPSEMADKYSDLIAKVKLAIADSKCNFVRDYDDGLLAQIGERGVKLSGGQKQRLAIAKLMIKNPKLIILDEPTSALDSFSEDGVTSAMERLFVDRTIIIIAHRLQTVKKADEIIVLENNKDGGSYIAERGNHEELVKNGGIYAKMLDLQSGF